MPKEAMEREPWIKADLPILQHLRADIFGKLKCVAVEPHVVLWSASGQGRSHVTRDRGVVLLTRTGKTLRLLGRTENGSVFAFAKLAWDDYLIRSFSTLLEISASPIERTLIFFLSILTSPKWPWKWTIFAITLTLQARSHLRSHGRLCHTK